MSKLLVLPVEAGAAAFLKPVLAAWETASPGFDWEVGLTDRSAASLSGALRRGRAVGSVLDRLDAAAGAAFIERARPSALLISAGGWPLEHAAVRAARSLGVTVLQFVDTWYGYRRRLVDDAGLNAPDRLLLIDGFAAREAREEGLGELATELVGHPHWGKVARLPPTERRRTLFVGAPVVRDYGASLGYTEGSCFDLLRAAQEARPDLIAHIEYAPHPEQNEDDLPEGVRISRYDPRRLGEDVDQLVGMFSSPLIDAYLSGRRSVSLQPDAVGPDLYPLSRRGLAPRAGTLQDLIAALSLPPPDPTALRWDLQGSVERFANAVRKHLV
ncbi:MAG: hypothetical protein RIB45_10275 [Marivibrio sp.]|uniref:hypothetical protein n=1 Tax=Marivibrio sp. TaxID=2039719 RepID=UPI0032ED3A55